MSLRGRLTLAVVGMLCLSCLAPTARADAEAMKETVATVRQLGTAMMTWLTAAVEAHRAEQAAGGAAAPAVPGDPAETGSDEPATVDWSRCPRIRHDDLAALLGPDRAGLLPVVDGWGRELEICLDPDLPMNVQHGLLGIRSAGPDGELDGDVYEVGPFTEGSTDADDVVWMDGYFVRWPQK